MEHVDGQRVETCDVDSLREGPHYAVGPLSLFLVITNKKGSDGSSVPDSKSFFAISEIQTASHNIPDNVLSRINLRGPHLFIELDLIFQDDPVGLIRLLPRQRQAVPGDVSDLDGRHWRGSWDTDEM